ncbi:DMT family transporter [Rhodococcus sp. I2R]|uniref:DMT family transporter n=1 Tax=Rhodococcus sp. I2R TaxID=2855445 RepID=UPI001E2CBBB2|nr:DMT family transporter [Rhodococcus sp. I2R]MCC8927062.1 DMT family transporter [Rhodococcus sp. I2R]
MTRTDLTAGISLVILWSSGFIGAEIGTGYASAHTLLAWRYVVAAAILLAWCWYRGIRPTWWGIRRQAAIGVFAQFLYLGCLVTGIGLGVPAGTAALIAAVQPLAVAALSSRFLGEQFPVGRRVALVFGFAGVFLVVAGDLGGGAVSWPVYVLPIAAMLALSYGTVLERRMATTEPLALAMCVQSVVSALLFMAWSLLVGDAAPPVTAGFWAAVAWVVVLSTFGAYGTYLFVLRRSGATRVSTLLYLTPATTMVWAYLAFGDRVTWLAMIGVLVTLASLGEWKSIARPVFPLTGRGARGSSRPVART